MLSDLTVGCTDPPLPPANAGTGKTLCLLCAALGWREVHRGRQLAEQERRRRLAEEDDRRLESGEVPQQPPPRMHHAPRTEQALSTYPSQVMAEVGVGKMEGPGDGRAQRTAAAPIGNPDRGPQIIYASRTHSQLTQVIRELKATRYRPRMAVIGSRQQMCVHKEVSVLSGVAQNTACKAKTDARSCAHHNEVDHFRRAEPDFGRDEPVDIEDLVRVGKNGRGKGGCGPCPYYLALKMQEEADIIFMPYNYLIDPQLRKGLGRSLQDAVLLFDEAHNIEGVCADSASFDISAAHLAAAVQEAQEAFEIAAAEEEGIAGAEREDKLRFNARGKDDDDGYGGRSERDPAHADAGPKKRKATEYKQLRGVLLALENRIATELAGAPGRGGELVRPAEKLFEMLAALRITDDFQGGANTLQVIIDVMKDAVLLLAGEAAALGRRSRSSASSYHLSDIGDALEKAFRVRREGHTPQFRLRIGSEESRGRGGVASNPGGSGGWGAGMAAGPTLSFWCFSPGVIMSALQEQGVRSIVLTSGTLSPMNSFAHELKVPFSVRLENPHVIRPGQVWGGVVPVGPSGKKLNSSYRFRDTEEYKTELGNVIVNFSRIIPDGLLVFFPSYGVMRACVETWKSHGKPTIWERISSLKHTVVEPTEKAEFIRAFEDFNAALDEPRAAAGGPSGAVFFAVCRGKVSEGIDFADKAGRGVILTGIPYAPKADTKVRTKRAFLDEEAAASSAAPGQGRSPGGLTGEQWYSQTAMRAVNQALGRVIRHREDYGAVILADERFANGDVRGQLSVWLRPSVQPFDSFGKATVGLTQFFRRCVATLPPPKQKEKPAVKFGLLGKGDGDDRGGGRQSARTTGDVGVVGGKISTVALPAPFRVDVDNAPPAHPPAKVSRGGASGGKEGGIAALLLKRRGGEAPDDAQRAGRGQTAAQPDRGVAGLLSRASRSSPVAAAAGTAQTRDEGGAESTETIKLFMRRAKSELSRRTYDELTQILRDFRAGKTDIAGVLRAATRILRAQEDPHGLYALFGAFVPAEHKHIHAKHLAALQAQAPGQGTKRAREDEGPLSRGTVGGSGGLPPQFKSQASSGGMPVAGPPPGCVCCGNAACKPFEAPCKHVACYSCWLKLLSGRAEGLGGLGRKVGGSQGAGTACPSCQKPVLKRQLQKLFFT